MAILKVAIIGASAKGRAGISAIAELQDKYQLVAICDIDCYSTNSWIC